MFANANRGQDSEPYTDISIFLPHPFQWHLFTEDRKVNIPKKTAIAFLQTYKKYDLEVMVVFEDWLTDIQVCASI